jgi:hypothetical protein
VPKQQPEKIDLGLTLEQEQFCQQSNREWKDLLQRADAAAESSKDKKGKGQ